MRFEHFLICMYKYEMKWNLYRFREIFDGEDWKYSKNQALNACVVDFVIDFVAIFINIKFEWFVCITNGLLQCRATKGSAKIRISIEYHSDCKKLVRLTHHQLLGLKVVCGWFLSLILKDIFLWYYHVHKIHELFSIKSK